MIHGLDHIALAAVDTGAAVAAYQLLLGRRHEPGATPGRAAFQLGNMRLDLEPAASSEGAGLAALGFATADLDKAASLLERRGLAVTRLPEGNGLEVEHAGAHGTGIRLSQSTAGAMPASSPPVDGDPASAIAGLDHVVVRSPNPERAVALYAGRLGLSLRLDRSAPEWGARLLFFRCGDLIVEVAHDLKAGVSDGPDRLWGLSWRVADIAAAHARLQSAGVAVSEVRKGRRPQTEVFTVKSHTAGVPTLIIGPA